MRLDEAIRHADEVARDPRMCDGCRKDHRQLADWLRELRRLRKEARK